MFYSLEAERAVLGCLLVDNEKLLKVMNILQPGDFFNPIHRDMYIEMLNKKVFDIVILSEKFDDIEYLSNLVNNISSVENIDHYINIIKSKAIRREYMNATDMIRQMIETDENETDIITLKNDIMKLIDIDLRVIKKGTTLEEITTKVLKNIQNRDSKIKMPYGIASLDNMTVGARAPELTILAARPSIGKTSFAFSVGINMARNNHHTAIFSLEMSKEQLVERMLSTISDIDGQKIKAGKVNQFELGQLEKATKYINKLPLCIYDDAVDIGVIRHQCRELKNNNKLDYIIIDYLQLAGIRGKYDNENARVGEMSRQCKLMCMEMQVPMLLLSQLSRECDGQKPILKNLRDSGRIEQDADNVIFLYDPTFNEYKQEPVTQITLIVAKQRSGITGEIPVSFLKNVQRWRGYQV